ncbi:16058_t:CDS:2, partial [Racocetra fulgida]
LTEFVVTLLILRVAENEKLKQTLEEHGVRFTNLEQKDKEKTDLIAKLEQSDKEKMDLIAKLEYNVSLIKGEYLQDKSKVCHQTVTNVSQQVEPEISDDEGSFNNNEDDGGFCGFSDDDEE